MSNDATAPEQLPQDENVLAATQSADAAVTHSVAAALPLVILAGAGLNHVEEDLPPDTLTSFED